MNHPHPKRRFVPQAVLTRSGKLKTVGTPVNIIRPVNTANLKPTVNSPKPMTNAFKRGHSQVIRPFNKYSANKNSIFNKKVNTVRVSDTTAKERAVGNPQQKEYKEKGVIDSGCSRHMTRNKCYLTEFEDYNGGFVSFGDGKGRISGKGVEMSQAAREKLGIRSLLDESQVLLRVPRKDNIYSVDLKSVVPTRSLTCLFAKATINESNLWHKRLGHINYKTMNKLVRGNPVRGLPSKIFENDHSCVACQKGKQHKASYKAKLVNSISKPIHMLHMDLFGLTNVKSLMKKSYCLVVTDDFSRFSWEFFLATKDETSGILKTFITRIENQLDCKVKVISVARTPQQNGVAERKNRTLIEAARTMLVNSKLPTTFWAEAVNTACYVLNRALVIKPHNKTPYELISLMEKLMRDFFVRYSVVSKAMRVFNKRTRIVEEILNIRFLENALNVKGNGLDWLFDVDSLTISMNYVPVVTQNQTNGIAGTKDNIVASQAEKKKAPEQEYIMIPFCTTDPLISQGPKDSDDDAGKKPTEVNESGVSDNGVQVDHATRGELERLLQQEKQTEHINSTNSFNNVSPPISTDGPSFANAALSSPVNTAGTPATVEEEVDINNVVSYYTVPDAAFTKFLKDHSKDQIEPKKPVQALKDPSWVEAMQDELLQNKKDERGIVAKNKARLVAQGYTQEEGIDYDEVFAPVARIEAIRLFMAYASFKGFVVYQMDVKSAFLYAKIEQEVYICQPHGFEDPDFPNKVYKVEKALYGLHQAPRACQDKCMAEILKKFNFATVKTASTPMKPNKALIKDEEAEDIDVHLYRSMIGLLMYLTAFRPDIIFDVCAYARFQVTPKTSRLHVVKRIFRYLKGQPKLGLWYPRDSLFYLEAFSDSDYVGASLNKKSTTGGCQFLGKRLISWQCKKQTMVANSTTEAEYVAATNCYRQIDDRNGLEMLLE
ncbi:putative ribonuclease H-like domain-containing protein [Tanacetum coccineum]